MEKENIIKSPSQLINEGEKKSKTFVFLGGPIQGAPKWRAIFEEEIIPEVTWISPERETFNSQGLSQEDWEGQVDWETKGIAVSDIILFWIPQPEKDILGRDYAQTTRMEVLECLKGKKNIVIGVEEGVHARRYLVKKCKDYGIQVYNTLEEVMDETKRMIKERKDKIFFTSDTHFSSERTLILSKRPFRNTEEMDWEMIRNWNKVVTPGSIVYHLGDFGNYEILKYLNGNIHLVLGNYEEKERLDLGISMREFSELLKRKGFSEVITASFYNPLKTWMAHEPLKAKGLRSIGSKYCLFGHIHGRQRIKEFGIDVGVDSNNYTPMSEEDVQFYLEALEKGYYDEEVFS